MTQEEKAKAYDEAIKRMKSWVRGEHPECFTEAQKAAEFIFPELVESEDENIRKEIILIVKSYRECCINEGNHRFDDCLTWLENQCENQKLDGTFVNVDDVREDFMKQVYSILDADATNDRANLIIDAFDKLPSITINNQYPQILANSTKICKNKQKLLPKYGQLHNN